MTESKETTSTLGALAGRYDAIEYLDADGKLKKTRGSGDAVAMALIGATETDLVKIIKDNGLELKARADYPNNGQYRMAVGNSLRAKVRQGEAAEINGVTVKKLDQRVASPAVKAAVEHRKQLARDAKATEKGAKKAAA